MLDQFWKQNTVEGENRLQLLGQLLALTDVEHDIEQRLL